MGGSLVSLLGHCGRFNYIRDESAPRPVAPEMTHRSGPAKASDHPLTSVREPRDVQQEPT
jgi:hypothetical protein